MFLRPYMLLAAALMAAMLFAASTALADRPGKPAGEPKKPVQRGAIDVRIHPLEGHDEAPADLLVTDTRNRKLGRDPRKKKNYLDIPLSFYIYESVKEQRGDEDPPESGILRLGRAVGGEYNLLVIGKREGPYTLEVSGIDASGATTTKKFPGCSTTKDEVDEFVIGFSPEPGSKIKVKSLTEAEKTPERIKGKAAGRAFDILSGAGGK